MLASHQTYNQKYFKAQKLTDSKLLSAEFHDCSFKQCSFAGASLVNCRFNSCIFEDCDISLAHIPGIQLNGVSFERCKLLGINWTEADWNGILLGEPLSFKDCALNHSTFIGLKLQSIRMVDCSAIEVDFREADLRKGEFSGSDFLNSLFLHTDLSEANLSQARNYTIAPAENTLTKARFSMPEALSLLYGLDIVLEDELSGE